MSSWTNYAISVDDGTDVEDIASKLESIGLTVFTVKEDGVCATSRTGDAVGDFDSVAEVLSEYHSSINGIIYINANDTDDSASGRVYEPTETGDYEVTKADFSGGESTRRDWFGMHCGSMSMDGGKYT